MAKKVSVTKVCEVCGNNFKTNNIRNIFCSDKCRQAGLKKTCPFCGKEFTTINKHKKYCSQECMLNSNILRKKKIKTLKCRICGKEFTNENWTYKTCCSISCLSQYRIQYQAQYYAKKRAKDRRELICPICGKEFETIGKKQKYCSKACYNNSLKRHLENSQKTEFEKTYGISESALDQFIEEQSAGQNWNVFGDGNQCVNEDIEYLFRL